MNTRRILSALDGNGFTGTFSRLYPGTAKDVLQKRYGLIAKGFAELFGEERDITFFSAPGRTEIGGNHTDHQRGRVLAAAVNLDIICAVSKNNDNTIRVKSEGHRQANVDLSSLEPIPEERGSSVSLVRGIAARCRELGFTVCGFDAYTSSDVPKGSGLSSSASFETAIGSMINGLFNGGRMPARLIAMIGQYAENRYFGKPSGLMDQMACSAGGLVEIDFADMSDPSVSRIGFDFLSGGYKLCIVNTGGSHSDLTAEYATIPYEMQNVARELGGDYLRDIPEADFYAAIPFLREKCGDRAILRAIHFYADNAAVPRMADALRSGDFEGFKKTVISSGESSLSCLQNVFIPGSSQGQGLALALALSKRILAGQGAWRIHGGGFAGTVQAYVPDSLAYTYKAEMERIFGQGSCLFLTVRPSGGVEVFPDTLYNL